MLSISLYLDVSCNKPVNNYSKNKHKHITQGWQVLPMLGFNPGFNPGLNRVGQNPKNPVTLSQWAKVTKLD